MAEQKTICGLYVNSDNWTNWDLQIVTCPYCLQEIEEYKRKYSDWFSKAKTPVNWENIFSPSEDKDKYPEPYKTKW